MHKIKKGNFLSRLLYPKNPIETFILKKQKPFECELMG